MRTYFLLALLGICSFFFPVFAQSTPLSGVDAPVDQEVSLVDMPESNLIKYVEVDFCSGSEKTIALNVDAGTPKSLCVQWTNKLNTWVQLWTEIVDGYTIDSANNRWCVNDPSFNKQFIPSIVAPSRGKSVLSLDPWQTLQKSITLNFPVGSVGIKHGCLTYGLLNATKDLSKNISVRFRQEAYIDVVVGGSAQLMSDVHAVAGANDNGVRYYFDDKGELVVEFTLQNSGTIDEMIAISGVVYNSFGFTQSFAMTGIRLDAGLTRTISTKEYGISFVLPFYKLWYNVDWTMSHSAYFDFDPEALGVSPSLLTEKQVRTADHLFSFPWILLAGLVVLLVLIKFAFFRKAKIVYVSVASPAAGVVWSVIPPVTPVVPPVSTPLPPTPPAS